LGDSSYGKYNWVGKKLSRRLDALGAHAVVERGQGDDQNEWGSVRVAFLAQAAIPILNFTHAFT
jgi:sulfite reductase alpha subunit-like flavoprotein